MFRKKVHRSETFFVAGKFFFSLTELVHLLISAVAISVVFAYPFSECSGSIPCIGVALFSVFLIVGSAFAIHESAHKLTAQYFGVWSEYRMWIEGLVFAMAMKVALGFTFIAPGAAYFEPFRRKGSLPMLSRENYLTRAEIGKIGFAGPLANIALALIFFALLPVLGGFSEAGIMINTYLALFNLIPFGPIDGAKVFRWSWAVWLATLAFVLGIQFFLLG